MNIAATRPPGQLLGQDLLDSILDKFDAAYGFDDFGFAPPELLDLPDPTLWRRALAEVLRQVALVVLHNNQVPGFIYDAILPSAQRFQIGNRNDY